MQRMFYMLWCLIIPESRLNYDEASIYKTKSGFLRLCSIVPHDDLQKQDPKSPTDPPVAAELQQQPAAHECFNRAAGQLCFPKVTSKPIRNHTKPCPGCITRLVRVSLSYLPTCAMSIPALSHHASSESLKPISPCSLN